MLNMKKATFNNLINLEYPDDFKELSNEENQKYFTGDFLRLSLHNEEKHILLSISKSNEIFINRFVGIGVAAKGALKNLENNLLDYCFIEEIDQDLFNTHALTECFSYTASNQEVQQYGELSVFKIKKAFYNVYCLSRLEDKEEAKKIFKEFRDSFSSK